MSDNRNVSRRSLMWSALTAWPVAAFGLTNRVSAQALPRESSGAKAPSPAATEPQSAPPFVTGQINVQSYGAIADGVTDDLAALLRAATASRTGSKDGIGRAIAGEIRLPAGRYRITGLLELAPAAGALGLTVSGVGAGTVIVFDGPDTTIRCSGSRAVTFRDLTFESSQGIDTEQTAFTIASPGSPLRSWKFERCEFNFFYRCFHVGGSMICSEFYFNSCQFSQCYYLLDNDNDQAVNWNFVNCNWENGEITTKKSVRLAAVFWLKKGTFVKWTGGSMIFFGRLVLYCLTEAGSVQRPSHLIAIDGVRIELEDENGEHVPFVDRIDTDYVSGTNQPTTIFTNCTILQRGAIPASVVYARAWANCSLTFTNCKATSGRIVGVLDGVSPNQAASIKLDNTKHITYEEDTRARLNTHDQHSVTIVPDNNSLGREPIVDQRLCSLDAPATMHPKYMYVRAPDGSLPKAGTTVKLIPLPVHTVLMRLFVQRFQTARYGLRVELRDHADSVTYGVATLSAGADRLAEGDIGAEIGFQIAGGAPLMLKFIGTPEDVKGIVGVEYL